jgi:hypothetical protein
LLRTTIVLNATDALCKDAATNLLVDMYTTVFKKGPFGAALGKLYRDKNSWWAAAT